MRVWPRSPLLIGRVGFLVRGLGALFGHEHELQLECREELQEAINGRGAWMILECRDRLGEESYQLARSVLAPSRALRALRRAWES